MNLTKILIVRLTDATLFSTKLSSLNRTNRTGMVDHMRF